ncbi:MAG: thiol reductant ABC exporter subunit CydD [Pseudomonadota bacterium]|nr:thiol reductant ABC exporter subunit CydD [Pseudomonadota bacterium]
MSIARRLKQQKRYAGPYISLAVAFGTLNGLLLIAQAWYLARVMNAVIFAQAGIDEVRPWLWMLLLLFLVRALLALLAEQSAFRGAARVKVALRDQVYRHIQALGPRYLAGERSGALAEGLTKGIEDLEDYFARFLPAMSLTALVPLAILVVVFPLDWLSGLIMLLTAPLIPLFMILIGKGAEQLNQRQWKELARMGGHFLDVIQGLTTLKLFNASRREAQVIARISDDYRMSTMKVLRVAFLSSAVLEFFSTVSIAIVAIFIGFRLYQLDLPVPDWAGVPEIGFFYGFFILLLAPEFYLPLRNLGTHYHGRMEAIAAAEGLIAILDEPQPGKSDGRLLLRAQAPLHVRFEDLRFAYEPGREALTGASFEIRPGERLALVGPSGSGKTTLISLLLGFIRPDGGRILVDGLDLESLDPEDWRRHLAWLPQSPRLFRGTLLDNIRLGSPHAGMDEVREVARRARADEFIEALPLGYQTPIGERGAGLSGGQIQRIALARTFLHDAPLVVLDEATANLDPDSEAMTEAGIDELARERTLLVVAHRLTTVRRADRILVLDGGRIVESGEHERLLAARGLYHRMVTAYGGAA